MPEATGHTTMCRQEADRVGPVRMGTVPVLVMSWLADGFISYQWNRIGTL